MRRLILVGLTVALLAIASTAPASACTITATIPSVDPIDGPPGLDTRKVGKPGAIWLLAVLDGNANECAQSAVLGNHDIFVPPLSFVR